MRWVLNVPFYVILLAVCTAAMLLPAFHAWAVRDWLSARAFVYMAMGLGLFTTLLGLATFSRRSPDVVRTHLLTLPAFFALMPLALALPFHQALRDTTFLNAYFEMVSSLTTTGATLFDDPDRLPLSLHLWRALVGWMGGLFLWITAFAILGPLNLGGIEVSRSGPIGRGAQRWRGAVNVTDPRQRLSRLTLQLTPIYIGATAALWALLSTLGEDPFVAACHAMSVLATSGISPVGGLEGSSIGWFGELAVFGFFIFGITRLSFRNDQQVTGWWKPGRDPEVTMAVIFMITLPVFLFLRHWLGAYDVDEEQNVLSAIKALWGSVFSVLSFLTTTGFVSEGWAEARNWSGLQTPGLVLLGLSIFGGGVATTAGGVKLLRVYALYRHGLREMEKLVHPSSVGGSGAVERHIRRQGAFMAWVFFMLFALSIAAVMLGLALTGLDFESATIFAVASLSTTGPVALVAGEVPLSYASLGDAAKLIAAAAMVVGRVETLAFIALLNPSFWRA
ncbi:potassium transporter TrkH [Actibacterium mucosum KCTC 23349]|uniref:Potassium transporter TrkH n=1 Tax=Actibacterium mucosum KCTC 23349 TaxID=1454373 RepID=A0A037ZJZ6_9RHOB|nr:potassium transporter TrkG [Actibacterium mucosum]KAJ56770.1 potassium transporter TrkH [Actibacterium mucosum KCTC 23349]